MELYVLIESDDTKTHQDITQVATLSPHTHTHTHTKSFYDDSIRGFLGFFSAGWAGRLTRMSAEGAEETVAADDDDAAFLVAASATPFVDFPVVVGAAADADAPDVTGVAA